MEGVAVVWGDRRWCNVCDYIETNCIFSMEFGLYVNLTCFVCFHLCLAPI